MSNNQGVNGVAVAVAALGGVLVYAGFRGVNPLQALRDVSSGQPPAVESRSVDLTANAADGASSVSGVRARVVAAAGKYMGDSYSQAKRRQPGYSDCSSFCDKCITDGGAKPPVPWANTANYRLSSTWVPISGKYAQPGDVAVSAHHMVLVTGEGGSSAIGQQNTNADVRTGSVASLMGSASYKFYTWKGYPDASYQIAQTGAAGKQSQHGQKIS
jgi:hypothetical protein